MSRYSDNEPKALEPFWTVAEDTERFFEWWALFVQEVKNDVQARFIEDCRKRDFYEGFQTLRSLTERTPRDRETLKRQHGTKIVVNRVVEVVEALTTQVLRNKSNIEVFPSNSQEHNDRIASKTSKLFIDHLWYKYDAESLQYRWTKSAKIFGDACVIVDYDPYRGDFKTNPLDGSGSQTPGVFTVVTDPETGEPILDRDGNELTAEIVQRTGDVRWKEVPRRYIVFAPGYTEIDTVPYFIEIAKEDKFELAVKYPEKANALIHSAYSEEDLYSQGGDLLDEGIHELGDNQVWTYKLYHKGTEFLDAGRFVYFTSECVLENKSLVEAVGHRDLPLVWISDWDIPDQIYSKSVLDKIMMLQIVRNNIISIMYTNLALASHIYWVINSASKVKIGNLRNAPSVIQYHGTVAPRIEQFRSIGGELFSAVELVDRMIDRLASIHEINQGIVPKRMDSGAGVAELDELQARQMHTPLRKHDKALQTLARLSLATAGAFYQDDIERTIRVVGKNNKFSVKSLRGAKLGGTYDIRVQRSSGLADSKSGRIMQIKELSTAYPGLLPKEQVLDLLDLGNLDQYYTYSTVAIEAAQRENEILVEGGIVADATAYEENTVHWYEHAKFMQSASFKEDVDDTIKLNFQKHVQGTEMHILGIISTNYAFGQAFLAQNPSFPLCMPRELLSQAIQQGMMLSMPPQPVQPTA